MPAIRVNLASVASHLKVKVRRTRHKAGGPTTPQERTNGDGHALITINGVGENRGEAIEVPINRLVAVGVQNNHAVAAMRAGVGDPGGGGKNGRANRLVGEIVIVAVVPVILDIALPQVVDDIAIAIIAAINRRVNVVEIGEMHHTATVLPRLEKREASVAIRRFTLSRRWRADATVADQFIFKIALKGDSKALDSHAPCRSSAPLGQEALHGNAFRRLVKGQGKRQAITEANGRRKTIRAKPGP